MEAFGTLSFDGIALTGQDNLTGSLWSNTAGLTSNTDLAGVLSTIRSTVGRGFKVGLEEFSTLSPQAERNLNASDSSPLLSSTSGAALVSSLFNQPQVVHKLTDRSAQDLLTGMAEGAPLVSAQAINTKINFQPNTAPVPVGYIKDTGKAYNTARGFGWVRQDSLSSATHVSLDITTNARDRNRSGIEQRLDTLIHMQGKDAPGFDDVKTPAAWEYKLPNGTYKVTVSAGDQPKYDSQHTINVEGVTAINDFQGRATQEYKQATVQAKVRDGKLTIDAIGGINTKINYIHIASGFTKVNWSTGAPSPIPRGEAVGGVVNGKLYLLGGYLTNPSLTVLDRIDVYNPANNTWRRIAEPMPKPLSHTGTEIQGNNIYLAGGYVGKPGGGQIFATQDVWKYNVVTNKWSPLTPLPQARGGGGLELLNGELHFFGGSDLKRQDTATHWALDLSDPSPTWIEKAPLPNARNHLGDSTLGGMIYAIGGQKGQDAKSVTQTSVHRYNPVTNKWQAVAPLPLARGHISGATFVMDGRIIVAGGEPKHGDRTANVTAYDPMSNVWTELTSLPAPRKSGVAGSIGNQIFYATGYESTTYKGMPAN